MSVQSFDQADTGGGAPAPRAAARSRKMTKARRGQVLSALSFAAMALFWIAATTPINGRPLVAPLFLPSPMQVWWTFRDLLTTGYQGHSLLGHYGISMLRFFLGFGFCVLVGVPLGLMMGMYKYMQAVFDPPIEITRPIPKLALLPLFIVWFGVGEFAKVFVIVVAIFPLISINAMQAVKGVNIRKIQAAQSLGATQGTIIRRIILPASLPGVFTGIRVAVGVGVTMLVGAEMVATDSGIAWMSLTASDFLRTDIVLVGVLIMALTGYLLDLLVRLIESRLVHWSGRE
jgi:taurine transport system permease protein